MLGAVIKFCIINPKLITKDKIPNHRYFQSIIDHAKLPKFSHIMFLGQATS